MLFLHVVDLRLLLLHDLWQLDLVLELGRRLLVWALSEIRLRLRSPSNRLVHLIVNHLSWVCLPELIGDSECLSHARSSVLLVRVVHLHLRLDLIATDSHFLSSTDLYPCGLV